MARIYDVQLKGITQFKGHEGEPCFQGNIYYKNKKIGYFSDDFRGGFMDIDFDNSENRNLIKDIAKKFRNDDYQYSLYFPKTQFDTVSLTKTAVTGENLSTAKIPYSNLYDIEDFIIDLLTLWGIEKDFKKFKKKYPDFGGFIQTIDGYCLLSIAYTVADVSDLINKFEQEGKFIAVYYNIEDFIIEEIKEN